MRLPWDSVALHKEIHRSFSVPARRGRRKTSLPELPRRGVAALFTGALKEVWSKQVLMNQLYGARAEFLARDPMDVAWDEAVVSIERRRAASAEWPWPARPAYLSQLSSSLPPMGGGREAEENQRSEVPLNG